MYGQQARTGVPELDAVLATAQMVTPDQKTPTVAAHVAQAAVQKLMPQGIAQGMNQVRQDVQAAIPSVARNAQEAQMRQALQLAMQPKPAGIEGLPSNVRVAEGGVVGYAGPEGSFVGGPRRVDVSGDIPIYAPREDKESGETEAEYRARKAREAEEAQGERPIPRGLRWIQENILRPMSQAGGQRMAEMRGTPETPAASPAPIRAPQYTEYTDANRGRLDVPAGPAAAAPAPQAPAPRPPAQRPPAPAPAAPTGVAALAQPKMDLSRYEKAGAEDRAAIEKIIAAQEANAREKAGYMAGRPKFEQEGIAALTKANQAREELLSKERADDAYNRQQALLDQIGRRNTNAYSQEQGRQRQRDLAAAEAQRLYEQAVIKQREAEFLQGAGRFEEAKKALDDKEKILSAMQARINQSRQTEAGIAERQFAGDVQMRGQDAQTREGELNRANALRVEGIRAATREGTANLAERRFALQQLKEDGDFKAAVEIIKKLAPAAGVSTSPTIQAQYKAAIERANARAKAYGLGPEVVAQEAGVGAAQRGTRENPIKLD
jgi:hypothetical protein